jgi:hypothetical protein
MADIESNVRRGRWIPLGPFTPRLQYTAETAQLTHAWLIGILRAFCSASESHRGYRTDYRDAGQP